MPAFTPWARSSVFAPNRGCSAEVLQRALNAELPHSMAVLDAAEVHDGFHATHDALRKRYRYVIHNGPVRDVFARRYAWHFARGRLDAEAMQRAAAALIGTHDFSSFETTGAPRKTSVRTVYDLRIERGRGERGTSSPWKSRPTDSSIIWSARSSARWWTWAAAPGRSRGRARCSRPWIAAGPAGPRRPQGLFLVAVQYP